MLYDVLRKYRVKKEVIWFLGKYGRFSVIEKGVVIWYEVFIIYIFNIRRGK